MTDHFSPTAPPAPRRSGLGRGLDTALAHAAAQEPPAQVLSRSRHDLILTVLEDASGTTVSLVDEAGRTGEASAAADADSITAAAIDAAADLTRSSARCVHHDVRRVDAADVATVLVAGARGTLSAGAAVVSGSEAFATAVAAVRAFEAAER